MSSVLEILGIGILLSLSAVLLKDLGFRGAAVFSAFATVVILSLCSDRITALSSEISLILKNSALSEAAVGVLKITGIGVLAGACSDICAELGEGGIARAVTVAARIEILVIALPYLRRIIDLGVEMLK